MKLSQQEYDAILNRPAIRRANKSNHSSQLTCPIPQCHSGHEQVAETGSQGVNTAKLSIVVTSFRRRLLDEDNLVEKWHVDALRYAGIISSDAPDKAQIQVRQEKVKTKEEERTVITVERV